jgi:peptidoglycan/xylan/chitin deacetylase (PgdA/CDA1 family)
LYASANTRTYFTGIGGNYEVLLSPWRNYFSNRNIDFTEIQTTAQLRKHNNGVLVLPSALSLSEEERVQILSFRSKGGAVLATWATGSRNGKGDWEGWRFLESLGAKIVGELSAASETHNLILVGESPVSHSQAAGQRIELSKTSEGLLRARGEATGARFMNWSRVADDDRRAEGAVIFDESVEGPGRFAYFAFAESRWETRPLGPYELIDDTLRWLRRDATVVLAAWPGGKRAAQVIEMDAEEGFSNALPFAKLLKAIDYRGTFYVSTSISKRYPEIMSQLATDFEIGYMGDTNTSFKGQSAKVQEQRIQTMRDELATLVPDPKGVTGFRAPAEGYDSTTEQLLQKLGIRHHTAGPSRSSGRIPLMLKTEGPASADPLVVLARTQRDDVDLQEEKLTVDQTARALISDLDQAIDTGSLGLLSIHSQSFSANSVTAAALPAYLDHLSQRRANLWLASAGQVADWWRDRDRFKLSSKASSTRVEFNITITGNNPVKGAALTMMLPQKGVHAVVEGVKIGMTKPTVTRIDEYRDGIVFDTLEPGSYSYQAIFSKN